MSFHKKHFNEYSKLHINQIHGKFFRFTGWLKPQWVTEQFSLLQHIHISFCLNFRVWYQKCTFKLFKQNIKHISNLSMSNLPD